jgi:hypothetical protein
MAVLDLEGQLLLSCLPVGSLLLSYMLPLTCSCCRGSMPLSSQQLLLFVLDLLLPEGRLLW